MTPQLIIEEKLDAKREEKFVLLAERQTLASLFNNNSYLFIPKWKIEIRGCDSLRCYEEFASLSAYLQILVEELTLNIFLWSTQNEKYIPW